MSKFGGGIGAPSKEERLKEAADIHLRLGQIQRYCELMVELGQVQRVCVCVCMCVCFNTNFSSKKVHDSILAILSVANSIFNMFFNDWLSWSCGLKYHKCDIGRLHLSPFLLLLWKEKTEQRKNKCTKAGLLAVIKTLLFLMSGPLFCLSNHGANETSKMLCLSQWKPRYLQVAAGSERRWKDDNGLLLWIAHRGLQQGQTDSCLHVTCGHSCGSNDSKKTAVMKLIKDYILIMSLD